MGGTWKGWGREEGSKGYSEFRSVRGKDVETDSFQMLTGEVGSRTDTEYLRVFSGMMKKEYQKGKRERRKIQYR